MELIHVDMRGVGAAAFAFMFALGNSTMALLGAIHPFWRHNMLALSSLTFLTLFIIAYIVPGTQFNRKTVGLSFSLKNHMRFGVRFPTQRKISKMGS